MSHIAPHRLADAIAGRASARESVRVERHLSGCERCAAARDRLVRARSAMDDLVSQSAPELGWDHIGVRVYWSTSSARHAALREKQRPWWRRPPVLAVSGALGLAAAAGFALTLRTSSGRWASPADPGAQPRAAAPTRAPASPAAVPRTPAVPSLRGVVTFASGAVALDGSAPRADIDDSALFASAIVEGAHLRTGEGRLVVQFGPSSGFALTPRSSVKLRRFDDRAVELAVEEGAVEVQVTRRRTDQSLVVVAGRHRVSVQGTAFQVAHREGHLDVECAHGRVVVSDGASEVSLAAGEQLKVLQQSLLARALRRAIDAQRLSSMEDRLARPLLPAWTDSVALFDTSSMVDVAAPAGRAVRVDGIEVGEGSFLLRVMSGRHHLEVASGSGGFGGGAWVEAEPRERQEARAGFDGVVRVLTARRRRRRARTRRPRSRESCAAASSSARSRAARAPASAWRRSRSAIWSPARTSRSTSASTATAARVTSTWCAATCRPRSSAVCARWSTRSSCATVRRPRFASSSRSRASPEARRVNTTCASLSPIAAAHACPHAIQMAENQPRNPV